MRKTASQHLNICPQEWVWESLALEHGARHGLPSSSATGAAEFPNSDGAAELPNSAGSAELPNWLHYISWSSRALQSCLWAPPLFFSRLSAAPLFIHGLAMLWYRHGATELLFTDWAETNLTCVIFVASFFYSMRSILPLCFCHIFYLCISKKSNHSTDVFVSVSYPSFSSAVFLAGIGHSQSVGRLYKFHLICIVPGVPPFHIPQHN